MCSHQIAESLCHLDQYSHWTFETTIEMVKMKVISKWIRLASPWVWPKVTSSKPIDLAQCEQCLIILMFQKSILTDYRHKQVYLLQIPLEQCYLFRFYNVKLMGPLVCASLLVCKLNVHVNSKKHQYHLKLR